MIGMVVIKRDATLLVVTEKGMGKCSPIVFGIAVEAALARPGTVGSLVLVAPGGALLDDTPRVPADLDGGDRGARSR